MRYWLMKSEPSEYSIDDLARDGVTPWFGVRNYQARNFMRDQMQLGDKVFFYHSSCAEPGIVGLARVASAAYPDASQFDAASKYFDAKSSAQAPRWLHVDVAFARKTRRLGLDELRGHPEIASLRVLQRGNRLSITPVDPAEWRFVCERLLKIEP